MKAKDYEIIMGYFYSKKMDRGELEASLDFENLTMVKDVKKDVAKLLADAGYKKSEAESAIKGFVRFVKDRSGSGEITWDELIKRINVLYLEESDFGIRVQRFSKYSYWEVFFNHFDITDYEDGNTKLTLNHDYYEDTENENASEIFEKYGFNTDFDTHEESDGIISQVAEKWSELSKEGKTEVISAIDAWFSIHYVDKSRVDISKNMIDKITMTNADLVPEVGLRDYTITFVGGDMIGLRF